MGQGTGQVGADPGSRPSPDLALCLLKKGFSLPFLHLGILKTTHC